MELTKDELREIVTEAVENAFAACGLGGDPEEKKELQRDFVHLRRWRLAVDKASSQTLTTAVGVLVMGALGALYLGIRAMIGMDTPQP